METNGGSKDELVGEEEKLELVKIERQRERETERERGTEKDRK